MFTARLATNDVATCPVLVQTFGAVPCDPAKSRLIVRFKTADQVMRGATSVAERTTAATDQRASLH